MSFLDNLKNIFANRQNNPQVQTDLNNLASNIDNIRLNQLASRGYDTNTINNVRQGLNGGDKYLQGFIEQNNIRTPQTQEEINLAKQGQFNTNTPTTNNVNQSFMQGVNQARNTQPQGNNNPEWRNYLASALIGIGRTPYDENRGLFGSMAQGVAAGANNYQNYKMAKDMYNNMGIDTSNMSVLGDYSNMTPDKALQYGIQNRRLQINQEIANAKDKRTAQKMVIDAVNRGTLTPQEGEFKLKELDLDTTLQESNDTRKTNSQIDLNAARVENIKNPKPKVTKTYRYGSSTVNINHNSSGGGGKSGGKGKRKDSLGLYR